MGGLSSNLILKISAQPIDIPALPSYIRAPKVEQPAKPEGARNGSTEK